ncbi:MAG: glycosyltransferase family 4 protein [Planctomycetales bacterium]|nr:glycosyltransferase family 4 protein [Planctomycetales bacterium]
MSLFSRRLRGYQVGQWWSRLIGKSISTPSSGRVCFFVPDKSKGWILDAVCHEIAQRSQCVSEFCGNYKALPQVETYFFCHYHFYLSALRINPWLAGKNCVVWFTHPKEADFGAPETIAALQKATVVTMCSKWRNLLIDKGLHPERVTTIVGAADPDLFPTHRRGGGKVGFCTAYYERKNPNRILELVRMLPEFQFVLLGRNWEQSPQLPHMLSLPNFEYREASYSEYPQFYAELDVFVSASELEGGPIPLLESMMSNVVPVASDTGFAPDVIQHGQNGFLFACDEPESAVIAQLVRRAMELEGDIRSSVLRYNWDAYASQHDPLFRAA